MTDAANTTAAYEAVATLYHHLFTGLLLVVASRRSAKDAGELTFRIFRRQHQDKFISSFEKLGLDGLSDAVAAAQYHYLSNAIGGVEVEYMYESDKKAWVHFCHPRWMYEGTALAAMPLEVSHGFLKGWYAHNGVSLKNPRLGFVCTSQDMDGQYGMAGYFYEYDHDLTAEERLRFAPGEMAPAFNSALAPTLDAGTWPAERLAKASRNYAMEYVRNGLIEMMALFGPAEAAHLGGVAADLIAKQYYSALRQTLALSGDSAADFARFMAAMASGQDDDADWQEDGDAALVRMSSWRLMRRAGPVHDAVFDAWNKIWVGALKVHNQFLVLETLSRLDYGDDCFTWRIRPREPVSFD